MGTLTDYLAGEFTGGELVLIAEYLQLAPVSDWGPNRCVEAINKKLNTDGVPAMPPAQPGEDLGLSLLRDYLFVAEYTDEDGKVTEALIEKGGGVSAEDQATYPCWSLADDSDPACARCQGFDDCAEERVAQLPACFGMEFDSTEEECKLCIEAVYCKIGKH